MSGHSHWAKIKRSKAGTDAKRGRIWSKLARRIIVTTKAGGGKPEDNLQLRYAIDDAKAANMPKDTIERAIKKGTGDLGNVQYEQIVYEGYGPGGVAFMVDCLTDNRNRTASEIRLIFERAGGQLGASNCVAWMFEHKGTFVVSAEVTDEDSLMEIALEAGADDVVAEGDCFEITSDVASFIAVKNALAEKEIETISGELAMVPDTLVKVDADRARKILKAIDNFEDNEDVQNVYANADIPEEVLAELDSQ